MLVKYKMITMLCAVTAYNWTETMDRPSTVPTSAAISTSSPLLPTTAARSSTPPPAAPTGASPRAIIDPTIAPRPTIDSATPAWPPVNYFKTIIDTYLNDLSIAFTNMLKEPNDPNYIQGIYALMRLYPRAGILASGAGANSRSLFCDQNPDICIKNTLFGSYQQFRECIINTTYYADIDCKKDLTICFNLLDLYITKKDSKKSTIERLGTALIWSYQLLDALKINPELTSIPLQNPTHNSETFSTAIANLKLKIKFFNTENKKTGFIKKRITEPLNTLFYQNKYRFFAVLRILSLYNKIYQNNPQYILAKTIRNRGIDANKKEFTTMTSTINIVRSKERIIAIATIVGKDITQTTEAIRHATDLSKISLWNRFKLLFTSSQEKKITMLKQRQFHLNEVKTLCDTVLKLPPMTQRTGFRSVLFDTGVAGMQQRRQPTRSTATIARRYQIPAYFDMDSDLED